MIPDPASVAAPRVSDYEYELPPASIAQEPCRPRDAARLLHVDRKSGTHSHDGVSDLPEKLEPGDLLIANDTRVRPARLFGRRATGGAVELLVLGPAPGAGDLVCRAMVRPAARLKPDEIVELEGGGLRARMLRRACVDPEAQDPGPEWLVQFEALDPAQAGTANWAELLDQYGRMPLPPYVTRSRSPGELDKIDVRDRDDYQTVFAACSGAVAAPTAGLHFTPDLLERMASRGIELAHVTLHVGPGTFRPVTAETLDEHEMHRESFELGEPTVEAIRRCKQRGGRVVAIGTTSARVLETCVDANGESIARVGETQLFISPGFQVKVVDALITNFHLPRSTLLMLVSALVGRERLLALYREALDEGYRFTSYGDAMLIT